MSTGVSSGYEYEAGLFWPKISSIALSQSYAADLNFATDFFFFSETISCQITYRESQLVCSISQMLPKSCCQCIKYLVPSPALFHCINNLISHSLFIQQFSWINRIWLTSNANTTVSNRILGHFCASTQKLLEYKAWKYL